MPEVGIFQSPEPNAFATGMSRNSALVAVSTGLLAAHEPRGNRGGLGHEMTHVANGDMVTLALIQGVVNTFVIFLSRQLSTALVDPLAERSRRHRLYFATVIVLQMVLGILASTSSCGSRGGASSAPTAAARSSPASPT